MVDNQSKRCYYINIMKQQKEGNMFKKISTGFGVIAIVFGIMMMAGAAGDCDGACMDQANSLGEMLMVAGAGLVIFASGIFFTVVGQSE